jgi:predicted ATPase/DNA-binding SARP family transcriptional activator
MARLELFLLGTPRLERDGVPLQFDTRKVLALVAYLAVEALGADGRTFSRDSLLALLWPDLEPSRARSVLRRNLSLLRSALEGDWLVIDRQAVSTDPQADFWLDVDQFTRRVQAWQQHDHPQEQVCPRCLEALAEAVEVYQGDFLEGFGLRDSAEFDEWQFFRAEEYRRHLASALERLVQGHSTLGDYEAAVPYARRWLALDPLHEPAHRQLMHLYARTGQRSAALRQYQECARILYEELGLAPAEKTTALYEQIRTRSYDERTAAMPGMVQGIDLPVRTAAPRHNLPAQTTPFVGREEELADISARLQDPACRLLTILGPGGIGKTRLALRLAENLVDAQSFEHGIFFVPLAPIQTDEGVVPAVAEALGFYYRSGDEAGSRATPRQQLLDYLGRKELLLVMDNYEHLLVDGTSHSGQNGSDAIGFVADLLSEAPAVKVLITSRAGLQVQGEHLYPLAGLRVPDAALPAPADAGQALRAFSAVELFLHGAQRVRPDFELRPPDLAHVIRICRLVQGMPLGILLAATWVEMLTPEEIAAEIQRSLDFLETDLRDVPVRQRSIRAVFDHSWRLLDERERELFQGLSVFCGGFTREAALEVVGASLRDLSSLVNKSLLSPSSPGRYTLHELLRQYAAERLDMAPQQGEAMRDRHCAYYSTALERWGRELKGPAQRSALAEMDLEVENARTAWYWAVARGQVACLVQGVDGMWLYHDWRLRHEEGEAAFRAAVGGLESIGSLDAQRLTARCLILWSNFHLDLGRVRPTFEAAKQGMALLQELEAAGRDVRHEMALALYHEARIKRYFDPDPLEAKKLYVRSVALYEEVGDRWGLAQALAYLGWMAEQLGLFAEAQELCERSLSIRRELGDQRGLADAMLNLGIISWVQGGLDEADRLLRESLGISRALDDWNQVAYTLKSVGEVLVRRGWFVDGLAVLESSGEILDDLGYRYGLAWMIPFLAEAKVHLGRYEEARAEAGQGVTRAGKAKHRWGVGFSHFVNGLAGLAEGIYREALDSFRESVAIFEEVRQRENQGWALGPWGLAARDVGETTQARQCVVQALQIGMDLGAFMPLIYGLPTAALLLADQGAVDRAVEVYACVSRYGFVANSCWFEDLVGQQIEAAAAALPAEVVTAARERGQGRDLQAVVTELLAEW